MRSRHVVAALAFPPFALSISASVSSNDYHSRPVLLIVPFAAGGTLDVAARVMADELTRQMGQSFIVDNRGGANGIIGTDAVARAEPDGQTLLFVTASLVINPTVNRKLPYDVLRDFAPITEVGRGMGYLLVTPPSLPVKSVRELVDQSKDPKNNWNYSSPGYGNTLHLAVEVFKLKTGAKFAHVPYKGVAPAVNGVIAGDVQLAMIPPLAGLGYVQGGTLKALAFTGASRSSELPDLPTLAEAGFPGLVMEGSWLGLFAPASTPPEIVARLNKATAAALQTPRLSDTLRKGGYEPVGSNAEDFGRFVRAEMQRYAEIAREAKIEPR
jgi:tripartite-type tricarboxylate transporter receptor subunit TctC